MRIWITHALVRTPAENVERPCGPVQQLESNKQDVSCITMFEAIVASASRIRQIQTSLHTVKFVTAAPATGIWLAAAGHGCRIAHAIVHRK